jgi:hypothetical protein
LFRNTFDERSDRFVHPYSLSVVKNAVRNLKREQLIKKTLLHSDRSKLATAAFWSTPSE